MVTFITQQSTHLVRWIANARSLLAVVMLLVGALLLRALLVNPIKTLIYSVFVPQQNLPLETGVIAVAIDSAVVITILLGSASVWLMRPSSPTGKLWVGGLSGVLVGLLAFAFVGSWAIGIAAQSPLYAVALTREGYNDVEWILKLAIAVNQTIPATVITFLLCAAVGGILGAVGSVLIPVREPREAVPDGLPLWTLVAMMALPVLQISSGTSMGVLIPLGPTIRNIFIRYGYDSGWQPESLSATLSIPQFVVIVAFLWALRSWLNRVYLSRETRTAPRVFLNTLFMSGLLTALSGALQIAAGRDIWWSVMMGIVVIGLGFDLIRFSTAIQPGPEPLTHQMRWIGAGLLAGLVTMVVSWVLIAATWSLILVSVVLIRYLAITSTPAIGLPKLLDVLNQASDFMRDATLGGLMLYMGIGGVVSLLLVKNAPSFIVRLFKSLGRRLLSPISSRLHSNRAHKIAILTAVLFLDLLIVHAPLFTFLSAAAFIRREDLYRVPRWTLTLALCVVALVMVTPLIDLTPLNISSDFHLSFDESLTFLRFTEMAVVVSGVIVYHMIALYAPLERHSMRYARATLGLSIAVGTIILLSKPTITADGGISRFDGSRWIAFTLDNSTLGTNLQTEMLLRADGSLWFANSGGTISTYDGEHWTIKALNTDVSGISQSDKAINYVPYLVEDADHEVWFAADTLMGRLEIDTESTGFYKLEDRITPCKAENERLLPSDCDFLPFDPMTSIYVSQFANRSVPASYSDVMTTANGNLWFIFQGSISHFLQRDRFLGYAIPPVNASDTDGTDVWFATEDGLYRFHDTLTLEIWIQPDSVLTSPEQVPTVTSAVSFVAVDAQRRVWFQTPSGLHRLVENDTFETILPYDRLQALIGTSAITALVSDANGVLWFGSNNGLARFDPTTGGSEGFNQTNSGLAVNRVVDVLVDTENNIWVSTFETSQTSVSPWLLAAIGLGIWLLIGFGIWRDYDNTPESGGRKIGKRMLSAPDDLYPQIYDFLALQPDPTTVRTAADQLAQAGLLSGGSALLFLSQPLVDHVPQFDRIMEALAADGPRKWAQKLLDQYAILYHAIRARSIDDIVNLELRANPGHNGAGLHISTHETDLDAFLVNSAATTAIWRAFHDTSLSLSKHAEVSGIGDRLSYLAAALSFIETAQSTTSNVPAPDGLALRAVAVHWRQLITQAVHALSGSADLRLELRTRQIHREETVTLVLKVNNVGQSAAENIRLVLHTDHHFTVLGEAAHHVERLSPNRSEIIEFAIAPTEATTIRVHFDLIWDDRLTSDKTFEYADEVRFYETSTEFTPIPNPYIVGHPVKQAQMFFGREDVFQFVEQNLSGSVQDRTLVLYGQRRTGKTSLLYQIINGRLGERFIPVLVDMQAIVMMIESTADFLGEILYQLGLSLQEARIDIEVPVIDAQTPAPLRVFDRFLDSLGRVLGERRVLLLFDEFELIESKIAAGTLDVNLLDYFRSLIQHRDMLVFVFTGTHQLEDMTHDYWSMLFNIALSRKITFLSDAEAIALIRHPVAHALAVDDLAIEKIIRLTRGHPYFTQLLCWALVNNCNEKRHNYATINDVNDVLTTMLTTGEAHFAYIWQQTEPQEQLVLAAMAYTSMGAAPQHLIDLLQEQGESSLMTGDIVPLLDNLVRREILETVPDGPLHYRYRLDILRLWIGENKPIRALLERRHLGRTTTHL